MVINVSGENPRGKPQTPKPSEKLEKPYRRSFNGTIQTTVHPAISNFRSAVLRRHTITINSSKTYKSKTKHPSKPVEKQILQPGYTVKNLEQQPK